MKELYLPKQVRISKIGKLRQNLSLVRKDARDLRQRNKELRKSRAKWKQKYVALQAQHKSLCRPQLRVPSCSEVVVARHSYNEQIMRLCVGLYLFGNCSFRAVVRVLSYLQLELSLFLGKIPSKSTVENWVHKASYYQYQQIQDTGQALYPAKDYALIIDESMIVGKQKMLVILSLAADKEHKGALAFDQVQLLSITVATKWTGETIAEELLKVKEKMGKNPLYIISDGDLSMRKGIRESNLTHIDDITHAIGRIYRRWRTQDPKFKAFLTDCAQAKYRGVMKTYAYLLPPRQRAKSRDLNLYPLIRWAKKICKKWDKLSAEEQEAFEWVNKHKPLINRLYRSFKLTNECLAYIREKGISLTHIEQVKEIMEKHTAKHLHSIKDQLNEYLTLQEEKLSDKQVCWHACSDVIESFFGKYKQKKAHNPFHGITILALSMGLYTGEGKKVSIKNALEQTYLKDIEQWKNENLPDNQVVKRTQFFKS